MESSHQYSKQAYEKEAEIRGVYKIEPLAETPRAEEFYKQGMNFEKTGDFQIKTPTPSSTTTWATGS